MIALVHGLLQSLFLLERLQDKLNRAQRQLVVVRGQGGGQPVQKLVLAVIGLDWSVFLLRECVDFVELPVLRLVDRKLRFPGQCGWVLDGLNLEIFRGEGLALVGASNSANPDHSSIASVATAAA